MNLVDELTQKEVLKFQLNRLNPEFIQEILSGNPEGTFNLPSEMPEKSRQTILRYLNVNYKGFEFDWNYNNKTNSEIIFRKKLGESN